MLIKTIFLDRDGVINKEVNYLHKIADFEFINGVFEACQHFQRLNYKIIIITNQSGISRGFYTKNDYELMSKWMVSQFKKNDVKILDIFSCHHGPLSQCKCRKPKPGMLISADEKYKIDMANSWMIGDKESDIKAANNAGIDNTILVKSGHTFHKSKSNAKFIINSIKNSVSVITK
jgi:D-glycero-D-manno-heptose 1,7-bisphosphate phosphatase